MTKNEFLMRLRKGLSGLPEDDIEERISFYSEMIDDRMEDGLSEEEAVLAVGPVDEIVSQIVSETPLVKIAKERIKKNRRLSAGEIVLLAVGSPLWLSLGIAAIAVILSLYISLWAVIISFWSVFVSFAACFVGGVAAFVIFCVTAKATSGLFCLGAGLVFAGLSVFAFYGCRIATKGIVILTEKIAKWIKNCIRGKEKA